MSGEECTAQPMAKQQRTTHLPGELFRLTEAFEARSGAKFNRQVLAALLQYFFTHPEGPDPQWMHWAVAIERGELTVGDMPKQRQKIGTLDETRIGALHADDPDVPGRSIFSQGERDEMRSWKRTAEQFQLMMECEGDDPIARIIAYWASLDRRK